MGFINNKLATEQPQGGGVFAKVAGNTQQPIIQGPTSTYLGSLPGIKQATQLGVGIGTAVGKATLNIPKAVLSGSQAVSNKLLGTPADIYNPLISKIDTFSNNIYQKPFQNELDSTSGQIGNAIGTVVPYIIPAGKISEGANAISNFAKGPGVGKAIGRTLLGAGTEGLGNFGTGYALSGGNTKQALAQGATAGLLKGAISGVGEISNALKVPEALNRNIFKTDKNEIKNAFGNSPEPSIAEGITKRGIAGNTEQIAQQLTQGMQKSESNIASEFSKAGNPLIKLEEPNRFIDYIKNTATLLRKSGAIQEAKGLENSLQSINKNGEITANNALSLRRFLDGLRYQKSFLTPTEELGAQQAGLKEMSDHIRNQINKIGGTGEIMKDYQFYIKAMDKLVSHALKTKNNDALGLINTFLLGESISNLNPIVGAAGIIRKTTGTAIGATKTAQFIRNLPKSSAKGETTRSLIGSVVAKNQN